MFRSFAVGLVFAACLSVAPASSEAVVKGRATPAASTALPSPAVTQPDAYPKTAEQRRMAEEDKKLDKAIKGICRGC